MSAALLVAQSGHPSPLVRIFDANNTGTLAVLLIFGMIFVVAVGKTLAHLIATLRQPSTSDVARLEQQVATLRQRVDNLEYAILNDPAPPAAVSRTTPAPSATADTIAHVPS